MKIKDVIIQESSDVISEGDAFDIELGDIVIETGVVGFTEDGVIVEADEKTLALLGISGALFESVDINEVSLGDYYTKATKNKALSQMSAAFAPSPEERAKSYSIAGRRERGLARAKTRTDKIAAATAAKQDADYKQSIRDKYAGVDLDAEIAKLKPAIDRAYNDYQYGARNTYSAARGEYQRLLAKVQELERAKEILNQKVNEEVNKAVYNKVYQILVTQAPDFMKTAPTSDVQKAIVKAMGFGDQISPQDLATYAYGMLKTGDINESEPVLGKYSGHFYDAKILPNGDYQVVKINSKKDEQGVTNPLNLEVGSIVPKAKAHALQYTNDGGIFDEINREEDLARFRARQQQDVAEGGMPASVIKSKQRYSQMTPAEFAKSHGNKSDDELKAMAWRHGYGKGSNHYVDKRNKGKSGVAEAKYQGREVPLGKPMSGDVKKSKVYVRGPKGNVVKVNFGDKKMKIKKSNPKRRKSFRARHNCANPGPRWKARYWSCRAW